MTDTGMTFDFSQSVKQASPGGGGLREVRSPRGGVRKSDSMISG